MHPRYGLEVEYLSDEWFTIFGWCVREAKRLGMRLWIYDEMNWPSGTAGLRVMRQCPDYAGKYLAVERLRRGDIDFETFEPGEFLVAANIEGGQVTKTRVIEVGILASLSDWWQVFNCRVKRDPFYVDSLSRDAVNCFKHLTYDEYFNRFPDEFGDTIRAVFTDEPSIYWVSVGYDDSNLPYTDDYFSTFEQRYAYSPLPMIPYLFYPGKDGAAFRADYWEHAGSLFNERYHHTLGSWCREHNVIYTGHCHHEEPLRYQIRFTGDMFGSAREMDLPGVDHLGKVTLGNRWIGIVGQKISSSQAHVSGKPRNMSESFGTMDWDTTFANLKRVIDWQDAHGINVLVPHALYHTISGPTKRESPPSFFYQSTHWQDFDYLSDYLKRLETLLCGGRHVCKTAIYYPLTGLWASYQPDIKTAEFEHIDNFLNSLCLELVRCQVDFDIIDFTALAAACLESGKLKLSDEEYEFLIVPATPFLRAAEVARLSEVVQSRVKTTLFHKAMEPLAHNLPDAMREANFVRTEEVQSFVQVLRREIDDDIQLTGGGSDEVMAYRREKDGHKIAFLVNRSDKHRKVTAVLKDYPDAAIFDPETGGYIRLDGRKAGSKTQVQLRFQPGESFFVVSDVPEAAPAAGPGGEPEVIPITNMRVEAPFNVASIHHFTFEGRRIDVRTNPRFIPANWDPNPPEFTEQAGVYEAEAEIDFAPTTPLFRDTPVPKPGDTPVPKPDEIDLILDRDFADCRVYVNDTLVELSPCLGPEGGTFLTDFLDVRAGVGHLLKHGTNRFKVISPTKLSEPLRLVVISTSASRAKKWSSQRPPRRTRLDSKGTTRSSRVR